MSSTLCSFIDIEAPKLFDLLTNIFSHQLKMSEIGITDLFIYKLTEYAKVNCPKDVTVYHAKQESVYGADIDLFVKQTSGKYIWYALQAKVMNYNGRYKDLRIKKTSRQQWQKLEDNEKKYGSKAYYLFYNGRYNRCALGAPTLSSCTITPLLEDYGYGIVKRKVIENHFTSGGVKASMGDFYPHAMEAFRTLFCCDAPSLAGLTLYDYTDIYTAAPYMRIYSEFEDGRRQGGILDAGAFAPFRVIVS